MIKPENIQPIRSSPHPILRHTFDEIFGPLNI
jgi:hypothetical protein